MIIQYENLNKVNNFFVKKFKKQFEKFCKDGSYILSNNVHQFEKKFSNYLKINYCSGVGNGLDALILSLTALNLPKNSEIILPANTYYATLLAVLRVGLKPVLVEPDFRTCNIDYKEIIKNLSKKTRAILVVHLYGKPCEMDKIVNICKENRIHLIEDCAQSHGAKFKNKFVGTFGDFGCFSFYPTKNLGALGDGGAVVSNNFNSDMQIKMLRNYGSFERYKNKIIGYNSRLDEFQASFLNIKLNYLNKINRHKRILAKIYNEKLSDNFIKPMSSPNHYDVFYVYNIRLKRRDKLKEFLKNKNIFTDIHYPTPPYKQLAVKHLFENKSFEISNEIHKTTLSLPISYMNTKKEVEIISNIVNQFS